MNQLKFISIATMLLFVFCFAECHKYTPPPADNPYGLPNATQTGANTMGCLINGVPTILQSNIPPLPSPSATILGDTLLQIGGRASTSYYQFLAFNIRNPMVGNFQILPDMLLSYGAYITLTNWEYISSGVLNITKLDKVHHIVSGTFSCKIPVPNSDSLNVTDGRFDISLYTN